MAIAGPSGSGKTTLLNLIGTLDKATSGKIYLDEQDVSALPSKTLADIRLRKIGFIFQSYNLIPVLTCQENAEYVGAADLEHTRTQPADAEEKRDREDQDRERTRIDAVDERRDHDERQQPFAFIRPVPERGRPDISGLEQNNRPDEQHADRDEQ